MARIYCQANCRAGPRTDFLDQGRSRYQSGDRVWGDQQTIGDGMRIERGGEPLRSTSALDEPLTSHSPTTDSPLCDSRIYPLKLGLYSAITVTLVLLQAPQLLAPTDSSVYPQYLDHALSGLGLLWPASWLYPQTYSARQFAECSYGQQRGNTAS